MSVYGLSIVHVHSFLSFIRFFLLLNISFIVDRVHFPCYAITTINVAMIDIAMTVVALSVGDKTHS